jgi:photosystem II stability/assembly factor-like uncharacterized protein
VKRVYLGTRKGLFVLERKKKASWDVASHSFVGDPVSMVFPDDRDGTVYAALDLGHFGVKLRRSEDGGENWKEVSAPSYPSSNDGPDEAPSLKLIWSLVGASSVPGTLWAGTIPGGLFRSDDGGESWRLNQSLWERPERTDWFGGGYDEPGIHSIIVAPEDVDHITVGVSCGGVWLSEDGGKSWRTRTKGMFAAYMPPEKREEPAIQDPHLVVRSRTSRDTLWAQHHNGIFRSNDGGAQWDEVHGEPSSFGFAVAVHPTDPDTAWFVPLVKDECRVPVDGKVVVSRTRDGGKSFEVLRKGLPQKNAFDVVFRHGMDVDDTGDVLAIGSTTGSLWVSEDQGDSWEAVSHNLPPVYCVRFANSAQSTMAE